MLLLLIGAAAAISRRSEPNEFSAVIADVDYASSEQFPDGLYEGVAIHVPDIYAAVEDTLPVTVEVRDARVVTVESRAPESPTLPRLEPARLDTDGLATFDVPPRGMLNVLIAPRPAVTRH